MSALSFPVAILTKPPFCADNRRFCAFATSARALVQRIVALIDQSENEFREDVQGLRVGRAQRNTPEYYSRGDGTFARTNRPEAAIFLFKGKTPVAEFRVFGEVHQSNRETVELHPIKGARRGPYFVVDGGLIVGTDDGFERVSKMVRRVYGAGPRPRAVAL